MVGVADQPLYCGSTVGAGKFTGQALAAFPLVLLRLDPEARARSLIVRVTLREELPRDMMNNKYSKLIVGEGGRGKQMHGGVG